MNKSNEKAITLISLVITIVVLLILAGITLVLVLGNNGIIGKSLEGKEKYDESYAREKLILKVSNLNMYKLSKEQRSANLNDLNDFVTNGSDNYDIEITKVEILDSSANVTIDKYIYTLNEFLKIISVDGKPIEDNNNNNNDNPPNKILNFTPEIYNENGTYFSIKTTATSEDSMIVGYLYYINGIYKDLIKGSSIDIVVKDLELNTNYQVMLIAIDDKGNTKRSEVVEAKTLDKLFLYRNGDECTPVTNGWSYTGYHVNSGGLSKYSDYMYLITGASPSRVYCGTNSQIKFENYKNLNFRTNLGIETITFNSYEGPIISSYHYFYNTPVAGEISITNYIGNAFVHYNRVNSYVSIYEVWLEK